MVSGRVAVVERLVAEPVCQRVDAEGSLLNEENSEDASIDEATPPIAPAEACNECREDKTHEEDNLEIVAMLPDHNGVFVEIRDVGTAYSLWVLLHEHPPEVRVKEAFADGVWVLLGVGVSMMSTVISCPPSY